MVSRFHLCGGCGKQGAYLVTTSISSGGILVAVQCRYCQAYRSRFSFQWEGKSAAEIALTLTPGPVLGQQFTPVGAVGEAIDGA